MSYANITETERIALKDADKAFSHRPSLATASALFDAAFDAWNESHLSDQDYYFEVGRVRRWLAGLAAISKAAQS